MIVRDSHRGDPAALAPRLRAADAAEVKASNGHGPQSALELGLRASAHCWTLTNDDGVPIGMFGVVPDLDILRDIGYRYGRVWYLGSDEATQRPIEFHSLSKEWLSIIAGSFHVLGNYVDARNAKHIRWLQALGFDFDGVDPDHGYERRPFLEFSMVCGQEADIV